MPRWVFGVQVTVEGETPEEARAWLEAELRERLRPDEEGGAWRNTGQGPPRYQIASVRQERDGSPTPQYRRGQG